MTAQEVRTSSREVRTFGMEVRTFPGKWFPEDRSLRICIYTREGNGRLARLLATLMALQAGLPLLDFSGFEQERQKEYFTAV